MAANDSDCVSSHNNVLIPYILIIHCPVTDDTWTFLLGKGPGSLHSQVWLYPRWHSYLLLRVRACTDAMVYLLDTDHVYGIMIGGEDNTQSWIFHDGSEHEVREDTPGVLSCDSYRAFWIHWGQQKDIKVGRGTQLFDWQIMSFQSDDDLNVYSVLPMSINTLQEWQFSKEVGEYSWSSPQFGKQIGECSWAFLQFIKHVCGYSKVMSSVQKHVAEIRDQVLRYNDESNSSA